MARRGEARRGAARLGWAWRGVARSGLAWHGRARHGETRRSSTRVWSSEGGFVVAEQERGLATILPPDGLVWAGFAEHVLTRLGEIEDAALWDDATSCDALIQKYQGDVEKQDELRRAQLFCEIELAQRAGPNPGKGARTDLNLPNSAGSLNGVIPHRVLSQIRLFYGFRDPLIAKIRADPDYRSRHALIGHALLLAKAQAAEYIATEPPPLPTGPFRVIVADPPWNYGNRADDPTHRARNPYPDMSTEDICALPVGALAANDCVLWLWTTNAHMDEAFCVVDAWGFEQKTILTWVKDRMGTGHWLRGQTEHCLLAVRGHPVTVLTNQTTVVHGPLREHSRKPDEFYALVEALCPGSKVELFSRQEREGWVAHGNEVTA